MTYLIHNGSKYRDGTPTVWPIEGLQATYPEINRVVERHEFYNRVEGTGEFDKHHVYLSAGKYTGVSTALTSDALRQVVRELTDTDAESLQNLDAEIAALEERLEAKREERRRQLVYAFHHGRRVLAPELQRVADTALAYREQRRKEREAAS